MRALWCIHRIIQVRTMAATTAMVPSTACSALPSSESVTAWTMSPATMHSTAAIAAPVHTARVPSLRPVLCR